MKKNNGEKMISRVYIIGAIALVIIMIIMIITVTIFAPREHTGKAQKYDLDCVTQLNEKPLQECRR